MNRLIGLLVSLGIGFAILYFIGMIFSVIVITVFAFIIFLCKILIKPKEYTEWEYDCDRYPIITTLPNDEQVFQNVKCYKRYNNFKQHWEFKDIIDPVMRPFNEAKSLSDSFYLSRRMDNNLYN